MVGGLPVFKEDGIVLTTVPHSHQMPGDYFLYQNYPNPFNLNTTISYQIPEVSMVTIKVYDMLGKENSYRKSRIK
jgi:hypothetical protein